jgi:Flp pilus assembly protein TadG
MTRKPKFIKQTEGAAAVIIALSLFALMGVASLAIDMGNLYTVRNEVQNVADAATLAGTGQLVQKDASGNAYRDSDLAKTTAIQVAQTQSQIQGQPTVADAARDDLTILFGAWDIYNSNPSLAWTDLGTSVPGTSNANAMKITITRETGKAFGPVTSLFANIFGISNTKVSATATAYLGYTNEVQIGGVQVPLALPSTGPNSPLASTGRAGWFARLLGPEEAVASTPKVIKFRDTGGSTVASNVPTSPYAALDADQPYFYTPGANPSVNSVPDTVKNIIKKIYTPSLDGTTNVPVYVGDIKVGKQIYPASEYCWGSSYLKPIFDNFKAAYNAKKNASGAWRTTLVVHGPMGTSSLPQKTGFMSLARLLTPFWPSEAFACATIQPPTTFVKTFVNVDITAVTSGTGDDGNYTYPITIATPASTTGCSCTIPKKTHYHNKKDFLNRFPSSSWNVNTATIQTVTDTSTVSPPGSQSGGPPADKINTGAPANVGAFATVPKLVK